MWKKFVKDYLSFTKKDRVGVIVLVTLIGIVVLLPYLWPARKIIPPGKEEIEQLRRQTAQLNREDTTAEQPDDISFPAHYRSPKKYSKEKSDLFYFDPNTLDAPGWKRLGIRDKTMNLVR